MELRCQRKGSVSYGLGADFSLPHCLVGDKVSESSSEPSPAGISEPRAEISWCIVMVQRSGKVSRGTAVGCIFLSSRPKTSQGKKRFIHVPCHVLVKLQCSENITSINTFSRRGIVTRMRPRSRACFASLNLDRFSENVRET